MTQQLIKDFSSKCNYNLKFDSARPHMVRSPIDKDQDNKMLKVEVDKMVRE